MRQRTAAVLLGALILASPEPAAHLGARLLPLRCGANGRHPGVQSVGQPRDYNTQKENGYFVFASVGVIGQHGAVGVGMSRETAKQFLFTPPPLYWPLP